MKTSESVVHPISPEHPLVVGDVVNHEPFGWGRVFSLTEDGYAEAEKDFMRRSTYRVPASQLTRISHAPTPEPLAAQKADLLEEADRVAAEQRKQEEALANEVLAELHRARGMFPAFASAHEGYAVLLEEVDELWDAVKLKQSTASTHREDCIRAEAIQVAAMAMRLILDTCKEGGSHE